MPLITAAYVAVTAGLLLGAGGSAWVGAMLAAVGVVAGLTSKRPIAATLAVLAATSVLLGLIQRREDETCRRDFAVGRAMTVRLWEPATAGVTARGSARGARCRVPVRVRANKGSAPAGATVRVVGDVHRRGAALVAPAAALRVVEPPGRLARWRTRTGQTIDALYGSRAPLARALLIADERDIAPALRQRMADAGIIHMLSVSGLHVAVLAEAVVLLLLLCRLGVWRAEAGALAVVVVFVAFVGAPAPAVRSGAMFAALMLSRRLQRPTSPWALLALGALVPLADPRIAGQIGYQLSVAGMAGLIAAGRLARRLPALGEGGWRARLGREVLATVVASAVTAPIVAWHFGRVSLAAPVTNLAAAPLFALAQPALFLSLLLAPVPPLAQLVAEGTRPLLAAIEWVAAAGAAIPLAAVDAMPSAVTAAFVAVASGTLVIACASRHWTRPALAGVLALSGAAWWPLVAPAGDTLQVHMIDVGQGDAIALRTPARRWIVVDAGDAWGASDAGARTVAPYLRRRGGAVAALVLSHPHADHVGGAASVVRLLRVGVVLDGGFVHTASSYADVITSARARRTPWRLVRAGDSLEVDGVRLRVLAPDSAAAANAAGANEASVVLTAEYRGVRVLLTGDAERAEEAGLVARFAERLPAHILKVGHHGSATSSTAAFLDAVRPRVALVSVGAGNRYGHPSDDVLRALHARGAHVARTDDDGTVVVTTDGRTIQVATEEGRWTLQVGSRRR